MTTRNARRIAREMKALKAGVRRGAITLEEASRRYLQLGGQAAADEAIRSRRRRGEGAAMSALTWTTVLDHGRSPSSFQVRCGLCGWRSRWHRALADAHAERRVHFAAVHAKVRRP